MTDIKKKSLFDSELRVVKWPKKIAEKLIILKFLYTKFGKSNIYTEKEVNVILNSNHTFNDAPLLRRALVDQGFLMREKDGSRYWVNTEGEGIEEYKIILCY